MKNKNREVKIEIQLLVKNFFMAPAIVIAAQSNYSGRRTKNEFREWEN